MANYCLNQLSVECSEEYLNEIKRFFEGKDEPFDADFSLNVFTSITTHLSSIEDTVAKLKANNVGSVLSDFLNKSNLLADDELLFGADAVGSDGNQWEDNTILLHSAWKGPVKLISLMAEKFPGAVFKLSYFEGGNGVCGSASAFFDGNEVQSSEQDFEWGSEEAAEVIESMTGEANYFSGDDEDEDEN